MKIFVDPRKTAWKGYKGPDFYLNMGCKKIAYFREWYSSEKIDSEKKIISSNDFVFVEDPRDADVVLLPSDDPFKAEYFLNKDSIEDICLKTETKKEIKLDEPYIDRHNPLLYMFGSVVETIEIGENIQKIEDWPNAFCECKSLKRFKSTLIHDYYMAESYSSSSDESYLIEFAEDSKGYTQRILHTFPPIPVCNKYMAVCQVAVSKIYGDAFCGPLQLDFLKLINVQEWECIPGPDVLGQRVIFICESPELVDLLLRRRIKAIHFDSFVRYCKMYGDNNARHIVKDYFDKLFLDNNLYLPNVYR